MSINIINFKQRRRSLCIQGFRVYISKIYKVEKDLINKKFDEKLPAEEVIYFLAVFEFKFSC